MDIQKLKYFIAVGENLNFSEAATIMGVSQSAISQQISELEKQVEAQLVIRNKRPLELTPAGKVYLKEAYTIVAKAEEAARKAQLAARGQIGCLKVGFLGGIEENFLPQGIREFGQAYPNIELILQHYNWGEVNKALMREDIDLAFTMTYGFDAFPELVGKNLFTDVWGVAVHRNHRLAGEDTVDVAQLAHERFVTFHRNTDYLLHDLTVMLCAERGFMPNIVSLAWEMAAILFMVESGLAISIVPGTCREIAGRDVRIIGLNTPSRSFDVMIAWKKTNLNPAIPIFTTQLDTLSALKALRLRSEMRHEVAAVHSSQFKPKNN
ncbi:MAG: gltC 6 [Firmicutes bacterium]|nr:gltC 6 [Bacillota bacterium]